MSNTEIEPPKRGSRVKLTCEPCRAGKLKCDRTLPVCDQCSKRSRDELCRYTEKGLQRISKAQNSESMRDKLNRLETFVNSLENQQSGPETVGIPPTNAPEADFDDENSAPQATPSHGTRLDVEAYQLDSIIDDIEEVKAHFVNGSGRHESSTQTSDPLPETSQSCEQPVLGIPYVVSKEQLLLRLPPKSDMDRYVSAWFNILDPSRVLLHAPTFQDEYQKFWLNQDDVSAGWLALLFATSSLGAEISGQHLRDSITLAEADELRQLTAMALSLADPAVPQPYVIEALLNHAKSLLYRLDETTAAVWQIIGLTMRLCFRAGYHRDPSRSPKYTRFQCEMRRRVWMVACELDVLGIYDLGMFGWLKNDLCDTMPPSNLIDSDFTVDQVPRPRPWEENTLVQTEICYTALTSIFGDIILSSHAVTTPSKDEVSSLDQRITTARNNLARSLKYKTPEQCLFDLPTQIMDRFRLESLYLKSLCVLYRRFIGKKGFEDQQRRCLHAAHTIVTNQQVMLNASRPGGQLSSTMLLLMRHVHDFTLAAALLCSELKHASTPSILPKSDPIATHALLLQVCIMWNPSGLASPKMRRVLTAIERFLVEWSPASSHAATARVKHFSATSQQLPQFGKIPNNHLDFDFDLHQNSCIDGNLMTGNTMDYDRVLQELFGEQIEPST